MANVVTINLLFMPPGAWSTSPSVTPRWFSEEGRFVTSHVEVFLTSVALDAIGAEVIVISNNS